MSADLLALLDKDPAEGITAVADLRERRARGWPSGNFTIEAGPGCYDYRGHVLTMHVRTRAGLVYLPGDHSNRVVQRRAEHIAAEANPAHALACLRTWRLVAGAIAAGIVGAGSPIGTSITDEARAYLGADQPTDPVPAGADPARSDPSISA